MTIPGLVGDPPGDGKISFVQNSSSVQNFRTIGGVEAPNSYNDYGRREGGTDILCVV